MRVRKIKQQHFLAVFTFLFLNIIKLSVSFWGQWGGVEMTFSSSFSWRAYTRVSGWSEWETLPLAPDAKMAG